MEACLSSGSSAQDSLMTLYHAWLSTLETSSRQLGEAGLEPVQRQLLASLLTLGVHDRDVVMTLRSQRVLDHRDFEWARCEYEIWGEDLFLNRRCEIMSRVRGKKLMNTCRLQSVRFGLTLKRCCLHNAT